MLIASFCAFRVDVLCYIADVQPIHTALQVIYTHFVPCKDSLFKENRIGAIHILWFYRIISHFLFYLFCVNCAFLVVTICAIVTDFMLLIYGVSLLRKRQWDAVP